MQVVLENFEHDEAGGLLAITQRELVEAMPARRGQGGPPHGRAQGDRRASAEGRIRRRSFPSPLAGPVQPRSAASSAPSKPIKRLREDSSGTEEPASASASASVSAPAATAASLSDPSPHNAQTEAPKKKLSVLQEKFAARLAGAKFRLLNEKLYTSSGQEALEQMTPEDFALYHQGFASQVTSKWPSNPVDYIMKRFLQGKPPLEVGDFGCGEGRIARELGTRHRVHSFDLVGSPDGVVVACDIAHVPLRPGSLDVAVYSLSLMGTTLTDFLVEAHRVLKIGGKLIIAEVKSRFAIAGKGQAPMQRGLDEFCSALNRLGFDPQLRDVDSNTMFVVLCFVKTSRPSISQGTVVTLKACEYKRR